jgi:hypothetical protein
MPTPNDVIVSSLSTSQKLLNRYCDDLTPAEYLHRTCPGGNCPAWLIGHLVLTERSALGRAGVTDLPPLPEGFEKRFSRDPEAPKAESFGDISQLLSLFNQHRQLLIDRVKTLSAQALEQPLDKPHPMFANVGQITMVRRSLGRPPIV